MLTLIFLFIQSSVFASDANQCSQTNSIVVPHNIEKTLKMLGAALTSVEVTDTNDPKQKIKPVQLKRSTGEEIKLVGGETIKPGDTITTGKNQTVVLKLFMPTAQVYTLSENSKMTINNFSDAPGQSLVTVHGGRLEISGEHRKKITDPQEEGFGTDNESSDVGTPLCQATAIGTKYSVDLNDAIAEASGDSLQTETYFVDKGVIQVRLRMAKTYKKINMISKRKDFKVSKNGTFKLRAGQKAHLKVNKKTKVADLEVVEP